MQELNKISITTIMAAAAVVFTIPLTALARETEAFQTPSGNIHCMVSEQYLRCDIKENNSRLPPKPKSCSELDWGDAFRMDLTGKSERLCHGDTIINSDNPVLPYGRTWKSQGFTCTSKSSGLTCNNQRKRGWQINRTIQKLF